MGLTGGYKNTEAGIIPDDWEVHQLGDLTTYVSSGRSSSKVKVGDYPVYGSTGIIGQTASPEYEGNSILVARVGANAGKLNFVSGKYGVTDNTIIIRLGASCYLPYFYRQLDAKHLNSLIFGSGQPLITGTQLKALPMPTPKKAEQRAIATALSDVDALLDGLDRLIAKKRDLKQAAMQQLLTGKTRLPGFEGAWEVKRLEEICTMKSGEGITSAKINDHSKYPCYGGNGLRGYTTRYTHDGRYALIGRQGALCGNVVSVDGRFFASEHAIVVTPLKITNIQWLAVVLARMNLNQYSESSAQPGLSVSKLLLMSLALPLLPEQTAIATILSDMDAEIEALEQRRAKTCNLKLGMMQELLTGRTRLV